MRIALPVLGLVAFSLFAVAANAQDPISARQAVMKDVGRSFGALNRMNRAQDPFDAAKAQAAFATIATEAGKYAPLFPENSKTGGETKASPAIWENKADFEARVAKLASDAQAASTASTDEAAFKTAFATVGENCGGCHQKYRVK